MFGTILSGFEIALVALFIYVLVYSIINRICNCIEHCALAKTMKLEELEKVINGKNS